MDKTISLIPVWVRALLACVAIPALWAGQLWVGVTFARFPELVFGEVATGSWPGSAIPVLIGLAVIWLMLKTPFKVLSLAFSPGRRPRTVQEVRSSE